MFHEEKASWKIITIDNSLLDKASQMAGKTHSKGK